ncbi:hypothetical protein IB274_02305 [Pseudomonas sp. PDM18]|uniref:GrlR family regulatory protein n=1 Tax=Pseudomonas sp. PDM18 TaxID=2769253 RepID=UPI0017846377|nr:GrlR family regulatory protein [Pseudomonas sp. PDM18]MBD9675510.1 hypothetical protein [Pseudomonas sp. PDM18]
MSQGIFHVQFRSSIGDHGDGLVVITDGHVNGGDAHFLYQGIIPAATGEVSARLTVSKWRGGNTSVVKIDNYALDVKGHVDYENGTLNLNGTVVGHSNLTIGIEGRKVANTV